MPLVEFVAGWISGGVGLVIGHPMDTIKVRLQTQSGYKGILDCVLKTYKHEKILGFFKGMSFPVLSIAFCNSLVFGSYSSALLYLNQSEQREGRAPPSNADVFIAGCFSGIVQLLVSAPVDLVKVRLQNQTHPYKYKLRGAQPKYKGPLHCMVSILREEGLPGLYRGVSALWIRDVPAYGQYFLTYEVLRRWMTGEGQEPGTVAVLIAGGSAGTLSWVMATPMDVIKARLQMDGVEGVKYRGVTSCIITSIKQEGVQVLFKGLLLNSTRAFPVNAVTFLTYESLLKIMD
ncbi:solute carrier family 25 member 45 [Latimeria chalumnae]|nr:PREDICTED: solute carrier family 25 member 45 [Latimeria chalumnae]|eukprot:XP_006007093.1 PREDICTED: solute carrier family 25 member 45 [Latimeria chalumnae]